MTVVTTFRDRVAVIELDRPEALNALNEQMLADLNTAMDEIEASDCRGIAITGAGNKAFCAGADISQMQARSAAANLINIRLGQSTFARIHQSPLPSVAAIDGFAFGGGLELALACTFRVATSRSRMGLPEIKLGLIPGYGGTQRLPRLIGEARAMALILGGSVIGADEALRIGLLDQIADDGCPADTGCAYLAPFCQYSRVAVGAAREAIRRGLDGGLQSGLAVEADLFSRCARSGDAAEGIAAFLEKRPAVFADN